MRIPRIEAPLLRVKARRLDADSWLHMNLAGAQALVITSDTWKQVPMELFGCVVLRYALNYAKDLEDMRSMVSDAMERTKPGGSVVAVARACDSGVELAEEMVRTGVLPEALGITNLSNGEIGRLKPLDAVLLTGSSVFKSTDSETDETRFRDWVLQVRQSPIAPDIRFLPKKLATRIVDVGLLWRK